jgi:hypothetical protein
MAKAAMSKDPLHILSKQPLCAWPDIKDLTPEQQAALHEFEHAVLVAGFRLYQVVSAKRAAPIILKGLQRILDELNS